MAYKCCLLLLVSCAPFLVQAQSCPRPYSHDPYYNPKQERNNGFELNVGGPAGPVALTYLSKTKDEWLVSVGVGPNGFYGGVYFDFLPANKHVWLYAGPVFACSGSVKDAFTFSNIRPLLMAGSGFRYIGNSGLTFSIEVQPNTSARLNYIRGQLGAGYFF